MHPLCCACIGDWSLELALTPSPAAAPAALSPFQWNWGWKGYAACLGVNLCARVPNLNSDAHKALSQGLPFSSSFLPFLLSR
jgi:hypothetical protein